MCKDFYKEIKYKSCFSKLLHISYLNKLLKSKILIVKCLYWFSHKPVLSSMSHSLRLLKCNSNPHRELVIVSPYIWKKQMGLAQQGNIKCSIVALNQSPSWNLFAHKWYHKVILSLYKYYLFLKWAVLLNKSKHLTW